MSSAVIRQVSSSTGSPRLSTSLTCVQIPVVSAVMLFSVNGMRFCTGLVPGTRNHPLKVMPASLVVRMRFSGLGTVLRSHGTLRIHVCIVVRILTMLCRLPLSTSPVS